MLARAERASSQGVRLQCADCGHGLDPQLQRQGLRQAWMGASGLALILMMGCLTFAVATLQEIHHSRMGNDPALEESTLGEKTLGEGESSEGVESARAE